MVRLEGGQRRLSTSQIKITANVVIVGAGCFGAWTAYHLVRSGQRVTLLDAYGPGNSRASSGGETRMIRMGYGAEEDLHALVAAIARPLEESLRTDGPDAVSRNRRPVDGPRSGSAHDVDARDAGARGDRARAAVARGARVALAANRFRAHHLGHLRARQRRAPGASSGRHSRPRSGTGGRRVCPRRGETTRRRRYEARRCHHAIRRDDRRRRLCLRLRPLAAEDSSRRCSRIGSCRRGRRCCTSARRRATGASRRRRCRRGSISARRCTASRISRARGFKIAFDRHGPVFDPDAGDRVAGETVPAVRDYLGRRFPDLCDAPLIASGGLPVREHQQRRLPDRPAPGARERVAGGRRVGPRLQAWTGRRRVRGAARDRGRRARRAVQARHEATRSAPDGVLIYTPALGVPLRRTATTHRQIS